MPPTGSRRRAGSPSRRARAAAASPEAGGELGCGRLRSRRTSAPRTSPATARLPHGTRLSTDRDGRAPQQRIQSGVSIACPRSDHAARRLRPLRRRAWITARPARVLILALKPCFLYLFLMFGWNVRFMNPPSAAMSMHAWRAAATHRCCGQTAVLLFHRTADINGPQPSQRCRRDRTQRDSSTGRRSNDIAEFQSSLV